MACRAKPRNARLTATNGRTRKKSATGTYDSRSASMANVNVVMASAENGLALSDGACGWGGGGTGGVGASG